MTKFWMALGLVLLSGAAQALEPGERLAPWTLSDQFEQSYTLDGQLCVLLVARSMDGAKLVEQALAERPGVIWRSAGRCSSPTSAACRA